MSFTSTYATTYLHPLEMNDGTFIERKNSISCNKRLSISSDLSDEDEEVYQQQRRLLSHNNNNWNQLLSQFNSQPDMMKLIQLCKEEEDRRCQEETRMKLKEYQVMRQLQDIQDKQHFTTTPTSKEFHLQLPPLNHRK